MKVLIIGNSVRSIACSAKRAGHIVYSIDNFGDLDTCKCSARFEFLKSVTSKKLQEIATEVDAVVLGSEFEKLSFKNALNNKPDIMSETGDKSKIAKKLKSLGIPHPETSSADRAHGFEYPLMIKPKLGSGGTRNIVVKNDDDLLLFFDKHDASEYIVQEFISGIPCSASLVSTGDEVSVISMNEQLIGVPWLTGIPFAYCGNVTPFHSQYNDLMIEFAKDIALEYGLLGSNGVDFIVSEKGPYVIEVNPRFQGSLDTVELATGINVFQAHVDSFSGILAKVQEPEYFAAKAIVFGEKHGVVGQELSTRLVDCMDLNEAADVPGAGTIVLPDQPITTLLATGNSRNTVMDRLRRSSDYVKSKTEG
jgi:predicted ATP-grasp superfamily ATP-dependent carboligase